MPGVTYHAIYISEDGEVATLGYQDDPLLLLIGVLGADAVCHVATIRSARPRLLRHVYVYSKGGVVAPLNPSSRVMYDRDFRGTVVILGDDPFDGEDMRTVRDFALDAIPGARLVPWPGREPDEETDKSVGN